MILPLLLLLFIPTLLLSISLLSLFLYIALYRAPSITRRTSLRRSAAVVVLGDVGRSPRMCYHVESLADQGWKVSVVGYGGSALPNAIQRSSVRFLKLREVPKWIAGLPRLAFVLVAPFKLVWQSVGLFWNVAMLVSPPPEVIIVQTPPALPSLAVIRLCSLLLSSRVIIDWHNLAYTILSLRLGASSPIVKLARKLERWSGRKAFAHLFVTHAMRRHLEAEWGLEGHKEVLHDRPPKHFKKCSTREVHALWKGLGPRMEKGLESWWPRWDAEKGTSTPFTTMNAAGQAMLRADRPALVVSSTSWTADEDFGLLLRAAQLYEKRAREVNSRSEQGRVRSPSPYSEQQVFSSSPKKMSSSSSVAPERHSTSLSLELPPANSTTPERASSPPYDSTSSPLPSPSNPRAAHRNRRPSMLSMPSGSSSPSLSTSGAGLASNLPNLPASHLPKLLIIVTGKGELRAQYERRISQLEQEEGWQYVRIRTAWLENWEYPLLLGSADLGVSLHSSSSGLDLPMKVVDMLGCHLPTLALDFPCLGELVQHGRNGLKFRDEEELMRGWESLLGEFPYEGQPGQEGGNWLVRGGGMLDPFALAGQYSEPSKEDSGGQTPRQSLEVSSPIDGEGSLDERASLLHSRPRSVEFSKGGLPTSTNFGPAALTSSGSASSLSHPSSPSPGANWRYASGSGNRGWVDESQATATMHPPRPSTPTPSFTMLASPMLASHASPPRSVNGEHGGREGASIENTWAANWKAKVRPLLRLKHDDDDDDEEEEGYAAAFSDEDESAVLFTTADQFAAAATPGSSPARKLEWGSEARKRTPPTSAFKSPKQQRKQRRIRGDSVHGLLWSEDFGLTPLAGAGKAAPAEAYAQQDEEDGEEDTLLSSLGIVVTRTPGQKARKHSSRWGSRSGMGIFGGSPRGATTKWQEHARKRSDEDETAEGDELVGSKRAGTGVSHAASSSLAQATLDGYYLSSNDLQQQQQQQPLRHRSANSAVRLGNGRGGGGAGSVDEGTIPDIRVSQQDS